MRDLDPTHYAKADRREVDPPIEVNSATWSPGGTLDWWVRERPVGDTGNSLAPHLHVQIQDRPSLASDDREVRTFPTVFEHTTLTRGGHESTPRTADLRRGDVLRANR